MFKVLTLFNLTLSDDLGGHLKGLASTKLKVETRQPVNQATACVRTARTAHTLPINLTNRKTNRRVSGAATHALYGDTGYACLFIHHHNFF